MFNERVEKDGRDDHCQLILTGSRSPTLLITIVTMSIATGDYDSTFEGEGEREKGKAWPTKAHQSANRAPSKV